MDRGTSQFAVVQRKRRDDRRAVYVFTPAWGNCLRAGSGSELRHDQPERDRWANYVQSALGDRYDAFLWMDETRALKPLHPLHIDTREPETYPSGV